MRDSVRAHILVRGLVQGVGYRAFVLRVATRMQLRGGVRNLPDGQVEAEVEGRREVIERLIEALKVGPLSSCVETVAVTWDVATEVSTDDFQIWF